MKKKFTIKIADASWVKNSPKWETLWSGDGVLGRAIKARGDTFVAESFGRPAVDGFKSMSAAKAYVIKQLAKPAGKQKP